MVFDRTLHSLRRAWRELADAAWIRFSGALRPDLPDDDVGRLRERIDACLEGLGGEVSARARAAELGRTYLDLDATGRARFLTLLATDYGVDSGTLTAAVHRWLEAAATDEAAMVDAEAALREVLAPPRIRLLSRFNTLPQGVRFLVDMRAELRRIRSADPRLDAFDREFRALLASWFDVGFLELRTITWNAPAALLEKLAGYEAVHPVRGWEDIKHRLAAPNRRCYAFVHPLMPDEPLIFVWVALTRGMADNVQELLRVHGDTDEGDDADCAVFYSISTAQEGLAGVSFGDFLIKRVVDDLAGTAARIRNYVTLSPIPGLRAWLDELLAESPRGGLDDRPAALLERLAAAVGGHAAIPALFDHPARLRDEDTAGAVREPLMRLAAWYLTTAKNGLHARDRVANFHLSNGATMERLNWMADTSRKGISQSAGMMINYRYRIADIERNHEHYRGEGRIAMSGPMRTWIKGLP